MAWYDTIASALGGVWRNIDETPRDPYKFKEWSLYWEIEWVTGAGYLDWKSNNGLNPYTPLVITSAPASIVIRPKLPLRYVGYHSTYGYSFFGGRCVDLSDISSYVYVRNNDDTKWIKIVGDWANKQTVVTYSVGSNDFTDAWETSPTPDSDHYFYAHYYIHGTANSDTLSLTEYWYNGASLGYTHHTNRSGLAQFFTPLVDDFSFEYHYTFASVGIKNTDYMQWSFNGNYFYEKNNGDDLIFNWTNPHYFDLETDQDMGSIAGSIDNDALLPLIVYDPTTTGETEFEADWIYNTDVYSTWYATYMRLYDPNDSLWAVKFPRPLSLSNLLEIFITRMFSGYFILMNADASKWFKFGVSNTYAYTIEDSEGLYDTSGPAMGSFCNIKGYLSKDYNIQVVIEELDGDPSEDHEYDLSKIFDPWEPIYIGISVVAAASYTAMYPSFVMQSENAAPNIEFSQTGANGIFEPIQKLIIDTLEQVDQEFYLYFKDIIRNSQDYSDLDSLFAMNPSYASDAFNSLKAGEVCIVVDRYHRSYFYVVKAGSQATNLPTYINITPALYWELIDYIQNDEMKVEQHDIVGLVNGTDKLITHAAHNRDKSYAPTIQLIHNGKVKTSDIVASVVSTTQIRLSTDEATAFENLKANVYVTV